MYGQFGNVPSGEDSSTGSFSCPLRMEKRSQASAYAAPLPPEVEVEPRLSLHPEQMLSTIRFASRPQELAVDANEDEILGKLLRVPTLPEYRFQLLSGP